ncbi:response regulator [Segatella copri]|uniref:hybrid sensor histidine kinase/response regulator transcription factor n=1 Tax=Segatella copri TaxID=165179 RepID=UPI002FF2E3EA
MRIYSLKKDVKGNLWMSTAQGIWCYDSKAKSFFSFEKGNGLLTKEYLAGVVGSTSDGVICYGNSEGLTYFRPSQVKDYNEKTSAIYLSGVLLDGKMAPFIGDNLSVPSDFKSIVLSFSQLDYQSVGNIVFQYRINGGKWISNAAGDNSFNFTGLSYGHYRIEVRTYCYGKYSIYNKVINLDVLAPWYLTVWAKLIYLSLVLGFMAAVIFIYLHKKKRDLEEAKMQFLINATHDIRSPLTLIMEPLKKLKERLGNAEEYHEDIDTMDRNAQRLLTLVNQILDKRRLDKHQMNLSCRETNLVEFSRGLVSLFTYNANLRGINIRLEMPETPVNAWIDRNKLDKAIANLLSNAFKYTPNGGEIIFRIEKQDKKVLLYVIDSGKGLGKNDDAKTLFERFYQGKNSADMHLGGSGIGLNLCRSIVRLHGGDVTARNREDGTSGACFIIELPLGKEHLKTNQIYSDNGKTKKKQQRDAASRNCKILLVDDDIEICRYLKSELSDWYRFVICNNGKEALNQLFSDDFDLVISDVVMPEMDGITLLKNIKGNANISHVPVIMLTSKSEISDRLEGIKLGADAYLAKPFSLEELHLTIDNLIDNVRRLKGKFSGALKQDDKVEKIEVKGNDEELMERIMKVVNENLSDSDFNVEKMCDEVGVSRTQLHRKLKEMTGVPTSEFLRNIRLNEAARLIREHKINITQVSYMVGFANNSHFSTAFKKYFGMSPTEYAAKYTE